MIIELYRVILLWLYSLLPFFFNLLYIFTKFEFIIIYYDLQVLHIFAKFEFVSINVDFKKIHWDILFESDNHIYFVLSMFSFSLIFKPSHVERDSRSSFILFSKKINLTEFLISLMHRMKSSGPSTDCFRYLGRRKTSFFVIYHAKSF
jgi:hypothetical protein